MTALLVRIHRTVLLASIAAGTVNAESLHAQTVRAIAQADSALLIATLPACPAGCADSARIEWRYGGQYVTRVVRGKTADTARVRRIRTTEAYSDTARFTYTPLATSTTRVNAALFVAPIVAAPVAATATPTATATATGAAAETTSARNQTSGSPSPATAAPLPAPTVSAAGYVQPRAPATVSIAYPALTGRSRRVAEGADLQAALDAAQPGDELVLANGANFTGNFVLPAKAGNAWIVVRSERPAVPAGTRTNPTAMANAAQITTPNQAPAIRTAAGAARWRLVGLQVAHATGAKYNYGIVVLGDGTERAVAQMPTDIVLDRMYIHGSQTDGTSRCVAFNGARLAVIDSWLSECHAKGNDAQGVCGWNGPGPFLIQNNRIEASGEIIMFGGADPRVRDVSPSDITIRRNHLYKPMSWARGRWSVKAAFELKHGRRVLFEGNVIENHWADAQTGFAILFQTLADNNTSWEWTTVQDVLVQNNVIRNSTSGVNILSRVAYGGGKMPLNPAARIALVNNWFDNVGVDPVSRKSGILLQLLSDLQDVTFARNSMTLPGGQAQKAISFDGKPGTRTTISDNVFPASQYGVAGSGTAAGSTTLAAYMPGGVFRNNVVPGQNASLYPGGGITGSASGVNMNALNAAIAGVVR